MSRRTAARSERASALKMASATPAACLGLKKGQMRVGYDAEFILCDSEMNLIRSIIL